MSSLHHNTFLKSFLSDFFTFFINVSRLEEDSEELKIFIINFVVEFITYFNYLSDFLCVTFLLKNAMKEGSKFTRIFN